MKKVSKSNWLQKIITQFLLVEKSITMRNSKIREFKNMWSFAQLIYI